MKVFESTFLNVVLRFFLMMGVVLLGGFTGQWWIALLALPLFLSAMLCVGFTTKAAAKSAKLSSLSAQPRVSLKRAG